MLKSMGGFIFPQPDMYILFKSRKQFFSLLSTLHGTHCHKTGGTFPSFDIKALCWKWYWNLFHWHSLSGIRTSINNHISNHMWNELISNYSQETSSHSPIRARWCLLPVKSLINFFIIVNDVLYAILCHIKYDKMFHTILWLWLKTIL